jgi:hypothetical protein
MPQFSAGQAKHAQQALQRALEDLFGPKLAGISGYGAGLDHATRELSLQVMVNSPSSARQAEKLPSTIEGLPVKVRQAGIAKAD